MPQDYFVRLVLALSTNTLYEGTTIIHFIVNGAYIFYNHNTMKQKIESWSHCSFTI